MNVVSLEIQGNDEQETREGYNMLNVVRASDARKGIEFTNNGDGSFTLNGTCSENGLFIDLNNSTGNRFTLTQGKKYLLYLKGIQQGVNFNARTSEDVSSITLNGNDGQESIFRTWNGETSENGFVHISVAKGTVINNKTFYPMLAESDVEVPYEPYGVMPSPSYPSEVETVNTQVNIVVSNKNILNFEEKSTSWNGSTITVAGNKIKFVGSETGGSDLSYSSNRKKVDLRKGTTITYSSKYISGLLTKGNTYYNLYGVNKDGKATNLINLNRQGVADYKTYKQATYTLQEDIKEIYIAGSSYSVEGLTELIYEFQLEIGDTATEIIEHTEQTKTVDIQKPMLRGDYFVKEKDGWKEVHEWNKKIFDGTDNFRKITGDPGKYYFGIQNFGENMNYAQKCNYFRGGKTFWSGKEEGVYIGINRELVFAVSLDNKEGINNLETWKNWLAQKYNEGNPVYIWYKLATPTKLACTEKQSAQLDDLLNTNTYKNVTHIYSTDKVSPVIKIVYKKDLDTILNNQKNDYDTRLSNIEKLLSTTTTSALLLDNLQTDIQKEVM